MTPLGWLDRKTSTQTKHQIYKTTDSIWIVRGVMQIVKDFFIYIYSQPAEDRSHTAFRHDITFVLAYVTFVTRVTNV